MRSQYCCKNHHHKYLWHHQNCYIYLNGLVSGGIFPTQYSDLDGLQQIDVHLTLSSIVHHCCYVHRIKEDKSKYGIAQQSQLELMC